MIKRILFLLLFVSIIPAHAGRIAYYDFEDGTFQGWTPGTGTVIATGIAKGNYSVQCFDHNPGDKLLRTMGSVLDLPEFIVRYKWYTESWDATEGVKQLRFRGSDSLDNPYAEIFTVEGSSPNYYFWGVVRGTDNVAVSSGPQGYAWTDMGLGEWTTITARVAYNGLGMNNGILQVWFDELLTHSRTDLIWRDNDHYIDFVAVTGNPGTGAEMTNSRHRIDDIEFFDRMPIYWSDAPIAINSTATGSTNVHYNRGNERIARFNDTVIALAAVGSQEFTYRSNDNGQTWAAIDSDYTSSGALISGPGEYVYHFFRSGTSIRMVKFLYDTTTIPAPVTIFTDADIDDNSIGVYRNTSASVDGNGILYVAENWVNTANGEQTIYLISSADGGITWSSKSEVSENIDGVHWCYQDIDVWIDNTVVVSYSQWDEGTHLFRNMVATSTNQGLTWTRNQVSTISYIYNPTLLVVDDDTIYIFAQSGNADPLRGLVFSKTIDKGATWSSWALVDSTCEYGDPSAALGEDGSILVSYRTNNFTGAPTLGTCGDKSRHALMGSFDGGQTWQLLDDYFEGERTGTKSHIRYQTHYNYGGPVDVLWLQYTDTGTYLPTFFDTSDDIYIAQDGSGAPIPTATPTPTSTPAPTATPTPTPAPTPAPALYSYGFEDWGGSTATTSLYPFGSNYSSYCDIHQALTEVVASYDGVTPFEGNYFFLQNMSEFPMNPSVTGITGTGVASYNQLGVNATYCDNSTFTLPDTGPLYIEARFIMSGWANRADGAAMKLINLYSASHADITLYMNYTYGNTTSQTFAILNNGTYLGYSPAITIPDKTWFKAALFFDPVTSMSYIWVNEDNPTTSNAIVSGLITGIDQSTFIVYTTENWSANNPIGLFWIGQDSLVIRQDLPGGIPVPTPTPVPTPSPVLTNIKSYGVNYSTIGN